MQNNTELLVRFRGAEMIVTLVETHGDMHLVRRGATFFTVLDDEIVAILL